MKLLFVCIGNSCRSQLAEGIARSMGFEAASAGTHPQAKIAENAIALLHERGIDTSQMRPKSLEEFTVSDFDAVISMGCGVECPAIPIDQDWGLEDPHGQPMDVFRKTAEQIERHLRSLQHQSER